MKKLLFYLITISSLTSCGSTTYFYSTLDSDSKDAFKDSSGCFTTEIDSIDVSYSFTGENAPLIISVLNKGSRTAYVDWEHSALIVNGVENNYNNVITPLDSDEYNNPTPINAGDNTTYDISAIPPFSRIDYAALGFSNFNFEKISNKKFKSKTIGDKNGVLGNIKIVNFSKSDSPFKFRSYISLYRDPDSPMMVNQLFYVSNLIKTKDIRPDSMHSSVIEGGNTFYCKVVKTSQFGEILLGTTLIVGAIALDVISSSLEENNN